MASPRREGRHAPQNVDGARNWLDVCRVYAARDPTEMIALKTGGNDPDQRFVRVPMRDGHARPALGVSAESSVSMLVTRREPEPTPAHRLRYALRPEARRQTRIAEVHRYSSSGIETAQTSGI